jgi:excisionase family DNA binding protein
MVLRLLMAPSGYVNVEEGAAFAGVSVSTFRYWIYRGRLDSVRPGRRRMVRRDVLQRFLAQDVAGERKGNPVAGVKQSRR